MAQYCLRIPGVVLAYMYATGLVLSFVASALIFRAYLKQHNGTFCKYTIENMQFWVTFVRTINFWEGHLAL